MADDFDVESCDEVARSLFDHARAETELKASIFWIRPAMLMLESAEHFIAHWQIKRDRMPRGIVEVRA